MSKNERGTKRLCGECGGRFYDLGRDPIICPVCETVFVVVEPAPPRARASRAPSEEAKEEAPAPAPVEPEPAAASASGPEIVSLEEAEAEEAGDKPEVDDEELAVLAVDDDDDDDIPDADDDDVFLETDDEEESDVTDIVPKPAKSGEDI